MKLTGYEFAEGIKFQPGANANAKVVGTHLEKIRKALGREPTAKEVLDDARKTKSPLHGFFEWNDGEAAEQYRLIQAQGLIKAVVAIYAQDDKPAVTTRASVTAGQQVSAPAQMSAAATHEAVLQRALRDLRAWRERYKDLSELAPVFAVADLIDKSLTEEVKAAA